MNFCFMNKGFNEVDFNPHSEGELFKSGFIQNNDQCFNLLIVQSFNLSLKINNNEFRN